ncbi:hypothetical protein VTJ83DRAFT_1402 [Remersonia thermophila]|uniref:Uncharacterized protein n=1 Tax=Remersonia thermophila TaxID=72144 RepID=A0ABR4DQ03_9PEZI
MKAALLLVSLGTVASAWKLVLTGHHGGTLRRNGEGPLSCTQLGVGVRVIRAKFDETNKSTAPSKRYLLYKDENCGRVHYTGGPGQAEFDKLRPPFYKSVSVE